MNRLAKFSLVGGGLVAGVALTPLGAIAKEAAEFVLLQSSSGAPAQTGHISVSGNLHAGSVSIKEATVPLTALVNITDTGGGYALWARSSSNNRLLIGQNDKTSGESVGVEGDIWSGQGAGIFGNTSGSVGGGHGVLGQASTPQGIGVLGSSNNYIGVRGSTTSATGYGVYSYGRFAATGTKSFQIDDPIDPENGYLNHYCTEGPEPLNVYSGVTTTDRRGYAEVKLPDYFGEINRDPRFHLTVIDEGDSDSFAQVKVVRSVLRNQFRIRSSMPGVKVSWRVDGVRNDAFVRSYGAPVRQEKVGAEKGKYLQPEFYGKDASFRVDDHHEISATGSPSSNLIK